METVVAAFSGFVGTACAFGTVKRRAEASRKRPDSAKRARRAMAASLSLSSDPSESTSKRVGSTAAPFTPRPMGGLLFAEMSAAAASCVCVVAPPPAAEAADAHSRSSCRPRATADGSKTETGAEEARRRPLTLASPLMPTPPAASVGTNEEEAEGSSDRTSRGRNRASIVSKSTNACRPLTSKTNALRTPEA